MCSYPNKLSTADAIQSLLTVSNRTSNAIERLINSQDETNRKLERLLNLSEKRLKRVEAREQSMAEQPRWTAIRKDRIEGLLRRLNYEVLGYSEYLKISVPLLSELKRLGLTTSAVNASEALNDRIPF